MATKGKSRWEDDEEDAAEETRRKIEKESRKKAKAEKDRLKAEQEAAVAAAAAAAAEQTAAGSDQPPTKRRRLDADATPPPAGQQDSNAPLKLLRYTPPEIVPCAHVDRYEPLNRIEEGSYGVVSRARDRETGEVVALKKLKLERETDGFPITSLREIQTLMASKHPNVVNIREIVMGDTLKEYVLCLLLRFILFRVWAPPCVRGLG